MNQHSHEFVELGAYLHCIVCGLLRKPPLPIDFDTDVIPQPRDHADRRLAQAE